MLDKGFQLIDQQTEAHSGYYAYEDLQSIELNKPWFPRFAKWLRIITWICNGVPYFPDANTYKKANIIFSDGKRQFGLWLTDAYMADKARELKSLLDQRAVQTAS